MKIVLTNDDGIESEGILGLGRALWEDGRHDVYILAPETNRSGVSHSISLRAPLELTRRGEKVYTCSGTPADCVLLACLGALPIIPDLVVSGINSGANLGTDIIFSGTAAAARQAALHGFPAVALSLCAHEDFLWESAVRYSVENLDFFYSLWKEDTFINVNIPNAAGGAPEHEITYPSLRRYSDALVKFVSPGRRNYFFIDGKGIDTEREKGSDWDAVSRNRVSISPVFVHPVVRRDLCENAPGHSSAAPRPETAPPLSARPETARPLPVPSPKV